MIINFIFVAMIVYGIPNCNTVKKSMTWLAENGFTPTFHDFKKKGITAEKLHEWCAVFGWEKVLNKKGTTWKKLSPEEQAKVTNQEAAVQLLLTHTSAIKRPVIELNNKTILISFDEAAYQEALK